MKAPSADSSYSVAHTTAYRRPPSDGRLAIPFVATATGLPIAVHHLGEIGPSLVLAHATGFHGRVWGPLAGFLSDAFRCVAFDHRGHGNSGVPGAGGFAWQGLAEDVLAVVDGLGLERPFAAGHSAGATALLLAEATRPGTFSALYCYEPVVVPVLPPLGRDPDSWLAAGARRRREVFGSRRQAYETYRAKAPLSALAAPVLEVYVEYGFEDLDDGTVRLKCRREHEAEIDELATAHDAFVRLPEIACPVAFACGAVTDAFGAETLRALAERLPRARVEVIPGLGHLGPLQDPAAVASSIRAWLIGVLPAG